MAPADAMLDLALSEELATRFRFENKTPAWEQAVRESMKHPSILIGVSDGGAHLDRDDGAEWSSYFLRSWVLDRGEWTLEEGIRQLTQVPAALAGFADRGALLPGFAADMFIFDPAAIGPGAKRRVHDLPGGERFFARPNGIAATIVNGEPIVLNGKLTGALPGQVVRPSGTAQRGSEHGTFRHFVIDADGHGGEPLGWRRRIAPRHPSKMREYVAIMKAHTRTCRAAA